MTHMWCACGDKYGVQYTLTCPYMHTSSVPCTLSFLQCNIKNSNICTVDPMLSRPWLSSTLTTGMIICFASSAISYAYFSLLWIAKKGGVQARCLAKEGPLCCRTLLHKLNVFIHGYIHSKIHGLNTISYHTHFSILAVPIMKFSLVPCLLAVLCNTGNGKKI